jgi:2-oxoglutarate dehydrogenase E1 component
MTASIKTAGSAVNSWNAEYLDEQYRQWQADPWSVSPDMQSFFQGFDLAMAERGGGSGGAAGAGSTGPVGEALKFQFGATNLIDSYRRVGHIAAKTDPFGREPEERPASLTLEHHGLAAADLDRTVNFGNLPLPAGSTLRQVIDLLERTYCGPIGAQFMHISDAEERRWLAERCERGGGTIALSRGEKAHVLDKLYQAEAYERFVHVRYQGQKRFSLEGGESLIPLLDRIIEASGELGVEEMVFGMAHRGRLNVLNTIFGKSYEQIFTEFEDNWKEGFVDGGGDVKYHRGYSGEKTLRSGKKIALSIASNPSHLESVNPVVIGRCRGKQRLRGDTGRSRVVPVLIHGDAAVIGQGVVAETLQLAQLEGYTVGGTIHVVINNLVGFTTTPRDGRTSRYCTDVGLAIEVPALHVNGEDPEAVVAAAQIAAEYRQRFKKDVFVDLVCYRKYGHNETDEPTFTQPKLYALIKDMKGVLHRYAERLREQGVLTSDGVEELNQRLKNEMEKAQTSAKAGPKVPVIDPGSKRWAGMSRTYTFEPTPTGVPMKVLEEVARGLGTAPEGFNLNPKLVKLLADRKALPETKQISYADAESLAFGTLLLEGHGLRITGQDCRRGTFSHRHAVLRDTQTEEAFVPLNHLRGQADLPDNAGKPGADGKPTQGKLCVYDSALSEFAVLGYEYGYSLSDPKMLVMWEAQFGDFCNGAQTIIDQYIASAELKWDRWSGLVMLLPHGYEGAGPEHSSARLERFLQLCANQNLQVVNPSTGAQCFHMFRRQLKQAFRKPLVVMTPKSMLRIATSSIDELTRGHFENLLDDPAFVAGKDRKGVSRVILCSGKIYFELAARREALGRHDIAIVRVEQMYPFDTELAKKILAKYPKQAEKVYVQEEPRNAGAYTFVADVCRTELGFDPAYIGRDACASPAIGSKKRSDEQQEAVLTKAVGPLKKDGVKAGEPAAGVQPGASNGSHQGSAAAKKTKR